MNNNLKKILYLLIFVSIIYFILSKVNLNETLKIIKNININFLILFLLICFTIPFIQAKRWQILTNTTFKKSFDTIIYAHAGSVSTSIPLSNEIIKFFRLQKNSQLSEKIIIIFIDKFLSIKSKLLIFIPCFYIFFYNENNFKTLTNIFFCFYLISTIFILFYLKKYIKIFFYSLLINILILYAYYLIGLSVSLDENIIFYSWYLIIELITQFSGIWGSREFLSVFIFEYFNINSDISFIIALIFSLGNIFALCIFLLKTFYKKIFKLK